MDRPERRRWVAGNSVFGSDRVKIDNSLPAGGRTSGYHVPDSAARVNREIQPSVWSYRPSSGPPEPRTDCSPDRRPAAPRTPRRACADRDRFPKAGTRWPPRRDRPCHPEASPADRRPRPASRSTTSGAGAASGRNSRSIASSTVALDRLQRHHAILHDGRLDPSDHPQPVGAVPREIEASLEPRQAPRGPRLRRWPPRVLSSATISICRPVSGMSATATGTLQGGSAWLSRGSLMLHGAIASGSGNSSSARANAPGSCASSRRLASRI